MKTGKTGAKRAHQWNQRPKTMRPHLIRKIRSPNLHVAVVPTAVAAGAREEVTPFQCRRPHPSRKKRLPKNGPVASVVAAAVGAGAEVTPPCCRRPHPTRRKSLPKNGPPAVAEAGVAGAGAGEVIMSHQWRRLHPPRKRRPPNNRGGREAEAAVAMPHHRAPHSKTTSGPASRWLRKTTSRPSAWIRTAPHTSWR